MELDEKNNCNATATSVIFQANNNQIDNLVFAFF
jgi:hypothetical protein